MSENETGSCSVEFDLTSIGNNGEPRFRVTARVGSGDQANVLDVGRVLIDSSRSRTSFLNRVAEIARQQDIDFDGDRYDRLLVRHAASVTAANNGQQRAAPPAGADHQAVLSHLGIEVLGEQDDQSIMIWVGSTSKRWLIKSPANWRDEEMLQALGQHGAAKLWRRDGPPPDGMTTPAQLKESVAIAASDAPRLGAKRLTGQGIWKHNDQFLLVNGANAHLYDGTSFESVRHPRLGDKIIDFNADKTWTENIVDAASAMVVEQASVALERLESILGSWNWATCSDVEVVAALVPSTIIQACWTWRPLISITGGSDSGKSTLLQEVLVPVLGAWTIAADQSTEAGLRQAIGCDAGPIVIDEFDKYRHRQQVLQLFRTSSRGGEVLRGTQDQSGQRYGMRHMAWFAAIESGDIWGQDRNRFIRLELGRPENRGVLQLPGCGELEELGHQLAAAALWAAPTAVPLADRIKQTRVEDVPGRVVECFAVPAAMCAALRHGRDVSDETAAEILRRMLQGRAALADQGERDEVRLFRDIVSAILRLPDTTHRGDAASTVYVERSVGQTLAPENRPAGRFPMEQASQQALETLEAKGIRIVQPRGQRDRRLFLAHETVTRELLANTRWAQTQIDQVLCRLAGAERGQQRCGGSKPWGVSLPWPGCLAEIDGEDNE